MMKCWREDPNLRPKFVALSGDISRRLEELAGYMDLKSLPLEPSPSHLTNTVANTLVQ